MITLEKKPGQDFIILNLSDTQLADGEWGSQLSDILTETIRTLIERTNPSLITISGDLAWANHYESYRRLGDFIDSFGIPWAIVWGNHDSQSGPEPVENVVREYLKYDHFLYERGDSALGNGNYVIRICEKEKNIAAILMMDTHSFLLRKDKEGNTEEVWAKLIPEQLHWYREQIHALTEMGCMETVLITHIPIYAYRQASEAAFRPDVSKENISVAESYGSGCWNAGYEDSFGVQYEGICSHPEDEGAFDVIKELKSTKTILAGHDHVNNWVIPYEGVRFVYALKTGPGCYWRKELNGGTVLQVTAKGVGQIRHEYVEPDEFMKEQ